MTNGDRAEDKGYRAGLNGKGQSANPYGVREGVYHRWIKGWERGRAEKQK